MPIKKQNKKPVRSAKAEKLYTFDVGCSFDLSFTFRESEVEQDTDGAEGDLEPTYKALKLLEKELSEFLGQGYTVYNVDAFATSDNLVGVDEAIPEIPKPKTKKKKGTT